MPAIKDQLPVDSGATLRMFHFDELVGEATFLELFRIETDPVARLKLAHLAQVETENKTWLRGPLLALGQSIAEPDEAVTQGRKTAHERLALPWREKMTRIRDGLATVYIPRFRTYLDQAQARGCSLEIAACRLMLEHDRAFQVFAERDLAGETIDQILQPLRARLRIPLDPGPTPVI